MEEFIRVLLKLSVALSIIVAALLIVGGIIFFLQSSSGFPLIQLVGGVLCLLGVGILLSMIFSCILPRK